MSKTPLRSLREKRGLTASEVAEAIGINQAHYSRIEAGEGTRAETAERIAEYFGREFITELHILYPRRFMPAADTKTAA